MLDNSKAKTNKHPMVLLLLNIGLASIGWGLLHANHIAIGGLVMYVAGIVNAALYYKTR